MPRSPANWKPWKLLRIKVWMVQIMMKVGAKMKHTNLNIWKINLSQNIPKFNFLNKHDFKKYLFINNWVLKILNDTGAKVLVCGMMQARLWDSLNKLKPSTAKIHEQHSAALLLKNCMWLWMDIIWVMHWFLQTNQFQNKSILKVSGLMIFSKLYYKSVFYQLELHRDSH